MHLCMHAFFVLQSYISMCMHAFVHSFILRFSILHFNVHACILPFQFSMRMHGFSSSFFNLTFQCACMRARMWTGEELHALCRRRGRAVHGGSAYWYFHYYYYYYYCYYYYCYYIYICRAARASRLRMASLLGIYVCMYVCVCVCMCV